MQISAVLLALPLAAAAQHADTVVIPTPPRELRAVWVATVNNMDWPSRQGLPADEQRRELVAILDRVASLNMNAVVFQVRPEADALYASRYEPWSRYLTGTQGQSPGYDPLAFLIEQAHRRGIEVHAWLNPYRAAFNRERPRAGTHVSRARPDLVVGYGQYLWMNPGLPEVRQRMLRVLRDLVRRYDVDAVHIDDYFYPYPEYRGRERIPFPDVRTHRAYQQAGGSLSLGDWRRRNVDLLVRDMYRVVKEEKNWVKVGISPFGIWRPGIPQGTTSGIDQYGDLYADARKWLREGWLDYVAPQLYWHIDPPAQSYPVLLRWWVTENEQGRHVWPGLALHRLSVNSSRGYTAEEVVRQVRITRETTGATGHIHFPARAIVENVQGIADQLAQLYAEPALPPRSAWLDSAPPLTPTARMVDSAAGPEVRFTPRGRQLVMWWVVQSRAADGWRTAILPGERRTHILQGDETAADLVAVTAVDRNGNLSAPALVPRR